jgi:hypothetical protein
MSTNFNNKIILTNKNQHQYIVSQNKIERLFLLI